MYFLYPIEITADNNTAVFQQAGIDFYVILTPGTYYAYQGQVSTKWPSLYDALESAINAEVNEAYTFESDRPIQSDEFDKAGITTVRNSGGAGGAEYGWGWRTGFGDFDYRLLGFNADTGDHLTSFGDEVFSDFSRYGVWQSPRPMGFATPKIGFYASKEQYRNNARRDHVVNQRWGDDEYRLIRFREVPEGHVYPNTNDDTSFATAAHLATSDHGNYWHDLWEHGISDYEADVIMVHGQPTSLSLDQDWEVLWSPKGSSYAEESRASITETDSGVRSYDLELTMQRLPSDHPDVDGLANYKKSGRS